MNATERGQMRGDAGAPVPPPARLARLMEGFLTTQALYVAAKLGVADVLAGGPRPASAIAEAVGADPDLLGRVLRLLVLDEVLDEDEQGRFALTPLGACLRDDVPGSLRGPVLARGELYYRAAGGMLQTVVRGGTAFEHVHGERFFEHLDRHSDREATFQASMAGRAAQETRDVVAAYDFGELRELVDVGGGGRLLLVEALLPERARDQPAAVRMDVHMLVLLGARERTEAQYRKLLEAAGFTLRRVVPTRSPVGLSVIEAVPAEPR